MLIRVLLFSFLLSAYSEAADTSEDRMRVALTRMDSLITDFQYESAIVLGEATLREIESSPGIRDTIAARVLDRLATCYKNLSKLNRADSLWRKALPILETALGLDHLEVITIYNNLAIVNKLLYRYQEADSLYSYVLLYMTPDTDSLLVEKIKTLTRRASLAWEQGLHDSATSYCHQAIYLSDSAFGDNHCISSVAAIMLANIFADQGMVLEADELYKQAIRLCEKDSGQPGSDPAYGLYYYARFLMNLGKRMKAAELFANALHTYEAKYGTKHPYTMACLVYLGGIHADLGNYDVSTVYLKRALSICDANSDHRDPYYLMVSAHLARLAKKQGHLQTADSLYRHVLNLCTEMYGPDNKYAFVYRTALASVSQKMGRMSDARDFARRALGYIQSSIATRLGDTSSGIHELLVLCREFNSLPDTSIQYYRLMTRFRELNIGWNLDDIAWQLQGISQLCLLVEKYPEASECAKYAHHLLQRSFLSSVYMRSDREMTLFATNLYYLLGFYLSSYFSQETRGGQSTREAANLILSTHGLATDLILRRRGMLSIPLNSTVLAQLDTLQGLKMRLASVFANSDNQDNVKSKVGTDSLCLLIERLETSIDKVGFNLASRDMYSDNSMDDILQALTPRTALVQFLNSFYYPPGKPAWRAIYLALIILADGQFEIVNIGDGELIDSLMEVYVTHMDRIAHQGGVVTVSDAQEFKQISGALYKRIWQPIEKLLADRDHIIIIPDGELNRLSFATLMDDVGAFLVEKTSLHYLLSARSIRQPEEPSPVGSGLMAIGGTDLDMTVSSNILRSAALVNSAAKSRVDPSADVDWRCEDLFDLILHPLSGARKEIETVAEEWGRIFDEKVVFVTGPAATEQNFKKYAPGSRIIHIATHGYFVDCGFDEDNDFTDLEHPKPLSFAPMLFSGLILSEVNNRELAEQSVGTEDGILTAYEVSAMNFQGTEFVVLSACESGIGISPVGHEIHGLPLAFIMAGAESVLSSLWPVSDQASPEILTALYPGRGNSLAEKLQSVQIESIEKLRNNNAPAHPVNWGAFVIYVNRR